MATGTKRQKEAANGGGGRAGKAARRSSTQLQTRARSTSPAQTDGQMLGALKGMDAEQLARGLGWFSLGLGLAELLAPRGIAKIAGLRGNNTGMIRLFGLREIAHGIGIFAQGRRPATAVWTRVAGDALDLAALGYAFASPDSNKGRLTFATANVLGVATLDVLCAQQLSNHQDTVQGGAAQVNKSLIINRPAGELYAFWRKLGNLPRFINQLESVQELDGKRSHWVAKAPAGTTVAWDAEIIEEREGEFIAWRSLEGAEVENSGWVSFEPAPGGRGTIVKVAMEYTPPGGAVGALVAKLFGEEPGQTAQEALRCFKQVMELGEVVVSDGTVWDNGYLTQRPAQPVSGE